MFVLSSEDCKFQQCHGYPWPGVQENKIVMPSGWNGNILFPGHQSDPVSICESMYVEEGSLHIPLSASAM